jgi:hypoxanthine phosphoribosyltransferase
MPDERERLSWSDFGDASRALAAQIHADGFEPDIILAIARGGLLIAGALGYALSVKNLYTMNVEYYTGVDERLDVPMILPPIPDPGFLANADVLIADDVADTGHTLAAVKDFCTGKVAAVRAAVLYEKPRSVVSCEYKWKTTDLWIEFPWSDKDPIAKPKSGPVVRDI